jgi:hypothetical protein
LSLEIEKKQYLFIALVSILPGFFAYFILSYLFVIPKITIPVSIILPILIFGLVRYYSTSQSHTASGHKDSILKDNQKDDIHKQDRKIPNGAVASIFFATIFALLLIIFALSSSDFHVFVEWKDIGTIGIIQLAVANALCFFISGLAIVLILTRKYELNPILTILLAYFFSILITGLSAYIWSLGFDTPVSELKNFYIMLYSAILVIFLILHLRYKITMRLDGRVEHQYPSFYEFVISQLIKFMYYAKNRYSELLVFGSIFMLLIVSTYYIYNGVTISDQWFHQGRALLFLSGSFRETVIDGSDNLGYPPFQSALLAALTTIAGIPIVNSYASIAFLNMVPVFAFYFFFSKWVPPKFFRASILASALFAIAAGFNWIYLLGLTISGNPITSPHSFLEILNSLRTVTIIRPTNFIFSAEPDFSTGLIYLALPAGLALLGVIQQRFGAKVHYVAIVTAISVLGILSHFEFFLFIMVAALLPPIFKLEKQNYLYLGLMLSFLVVFLIDTLLPGNYYSSNIIFGFSLLYLIVIFVTVIWAFYLVIGKFGRLQIKLPPFHEFSTKFPKIKNRFYILLAVLLISLTLYMYFLSYNVLTQLSTDYLKKNTEGYVVPWYVYPTKLGLPGLLGLIFIFSYFIKKFDNKLFVFGILIIVAFITGNFYDEHRFSKFIMIGMVAYASLLIYRIINLDFINKIYLNGILISALIVCSALSVVLYIGSNSLVLQTMDFTINPKREFPQMSEIQLYDKFLNRTDIGSKRNNIVSFPSEYYFVQGSPLMSKLQGFSGFPSGKIFTNPLSLNSSTLDAFYRQLKDSDVQFIILPKVSINDNSLLSEPTRFALQYFNRFYEDKDYIVLQVPLLNAPSLSTNVPVALLYNLGSDLPSPQVHNTVVLPYNNNTFDFRVTNGSTAIQKDTQGKNVSLLGSNIDKGIPLWSRVIPPEQKIDYIETKFRITSENENKSKSNDIRLKWWEGNKEYYILLSKSGLELYQQSIGNHSDRKVIAKNPWVEKIDGKWYTVKIARENSSINVFVDDVPKIQVASPLTGMHNESISRIGLITLLNNVEFGPLKIANLDTAPTQNYSDTKYYDFYYPLTLLALSKIPYDIFNDEDLSAFSKDVIVISDPLKLDDNKFKMYLNFLRAGGTLIVINSNNNYIRPFGQLFSLQSNDGKIEKFTTIASDKNHSEIVKVTGLVNRFELQPSSDVNVIATYKNKNNQTIAPFAIQKTFPNNGKIVYVNAGGYFNAISGSPRQYLPTLANFSDIIGFKKEPKQISSSSQEKATSNGFIRNMDLNGKITLNASSLLFGDEISYPYPINALSVDIFNKTNSPSITLNNVTLKDLNMIGRYNAIIDFTGRIELPESMSDRSYIGLSIPSDFNMTLKLYPKGLSYIEIITENGTSTNSIKVNGESKIQFHNISAYPPLNYLPIMLKNPEVSINGETDIINGLQNGFLTKRGTLNTGTPLDIKGQLNARFGFVDNYNQYSKNGTLINYITYLQAVTVNNTAPEHNASLSLPADFGSLLHDRELVMALQNAIASPSNLIVVVVLTVVTMITIRLIQKNKKL